MKPELLQKIKALSEVGVGGEKDNALVLLNKLMSSTAGADLPIEEPEEHRFHYHNHWEKRLLLQIMSKIATDRQKYRYLSGPGSKSTVCCVCTETEKLQIEFEYAFYSRLWAEELETFFHAFVQKHRLFAPTPVHTNKLAPEELERIGILMAGLQDRAPTPLIEEVTHNKVKKG